MTQKKKYLASNNALSESASFNPLKKKENHPTSRGVLSKKKTKKKKNNF